MERSHAQRGAGQDRATVGFVQVGTHAGHVTDVVANVVGDRRRVPGIVFGNPRLDLANQVGTHIGRLGEDAAPDSSEQRLGTGSHSEAEHRHGDFGQGHRTFEHEVKGSEPQADVEQTQADNRQTHHGPTAKGHLQALVERVHGSLRGARTGPGGRFHPEPTRQSAEEATGQKRERHQWMLGTQHE